MAAEHEPAKMLFPYLQRADELQKHEPLVAYYCRLYAMEKGLVIPQRERTKTTSSLLVSLMNQLEKDKKPLKLSPDDHLHLEGFALNVFWKADKQDRTGWADLNTAKTFYAASIFFEILNQFGPLPPDIEEKQKYAVWKAADIRKALKEGRKPDPGPPANDDDVSAPSSTSYDLGPSETSATTPRSEFNPLPQLPDGINRQHSASIPSQTHFDDSSNNQHSTNDVPSPGSYPNAGCLSHDFHPPPPPSGYTPQEASLYSYPNFHSYSSFSESSLPSAPSHHPSYYQGSDSAHALQSPSPAASHTSIAQQSPSGTIGNISDHVPAFSETYHSDSNYQPPPEKIAEAQKAARFAVSALGFDEVPVAVEHLKKSLELLTMPSAGH